MLLPALVLVLVGVAHLPISSLRHSWLPHISLSSQQVLSTLSSFRFSLHPTSFFAARSFVRSDRRYPRQRRRPALPRHARVDGFSGGGILPPAAVPIRPGHPGFRGYTGLSCLTLSVLLIRMGVYLSTPKTDKLSENGENDRLKFGLSSMQGWRATMEDAHSALLDLDSETAFFGVFDGHGGRVVAKFCAKYLHGQVLKSEAYSAGDLGAAVHRAFFRMDEMMRGQRGWRELSALGDKINKFSGMIEGLIWSPRGSDSNSQQDDWASEEGPHSDFAGPTCGSTACVALIRNSQLVVANAGDSRCVISRDGKAYNLSRDHKPELAVERERIMKAGGFIHMGRVNGSLNLSRAIGDVELKQNNFLPPEKQIVTANPDINVVELCDDDDFVVVACDGIWDCMSSQQLVDFIHERINTESSLSAVCERVLDRCLAPSTIGGDGCDNMTMILVQIKKPVNRNKKAEVAGQSANNADEVKSRVAEE